MGHLWAEAACDSPLPLPSCFGGFSKVLDEGGFFSLKQGSRAKPAVDMQCERETSLCHLKHGDLGVVRN